jgi:hypothetical protein
VQQRPSRPAVIKALHRQPLMRPTTLGNGEPAMTDITVDVKTEAYHGRGAPHLDQRPNPIGAVVLFCLQAAGLGYGVKGLLDDTASVH